MKWISLPAALACVGCSQADVGQGVDTHFDSRMASQALDNSPFTLDKLKVHAVCGPSEGKGLFGDSEYREWEPDGITDGRLIFVSGADDTGPNVIFRDASGSYTSSLQDGADVRLIDSTSAANGSMWIVAYPTTGIVETHNLFSRRDGFFDLWTSNKPTSVLGSPSAKIFISNCVRP